MGIRFVSLIMSFIILLSVFSVGCGKPTVINETVSLAPIGETKPSITETLTTIARPRS